MPTQTVPVAKSAVMAKGLGGATPTTFSGWNGKDNHLQVGATSSIKWRALIRFALWELPNNITSINSAKVRLTCSTNGSHSSNNGTTIQIKIGRMYADWAELSVNPGEGLAQSGLTYHWDNRYNKFTSAKTSGNRTMKADGVLLDGGTGGDIDITDIVNEWEFGGKANYGIILINATSETNNTKAALFYSDETGTAGYRPELIVDYETNNAPTGVEYVSPVDGVTLNTLTPTFNLDLVDPDGDEITSWRILTIDSNDYTQWDSGKQPVTANNTPEGSWSLAAVGGNSISVPYGTGGGAAPLISGETYTWWARLWDEGDVSVDGPTSASPYTFTLNAPPNAPSVTVTPTPLSAVPTATPTYSITHNDPDPADTLMDGYNLTVQEESSEGAGDWTTTWAPGAVDLSGSPSAYANVTSTTLDWGVSYRVYAQTQDSSGSWGPTNTPVTFVTQKASVPINLEPSGGTITSATPTLTGARATTADTITSYEIEVYDDTLTTAFWTPTAFTDSNGSTFNKLYAGTTLVAGDSYKWRARITSSVGGTSEWSSWQDFTILADTSVPTITSPVGDNSYTLTPSIAFNRAANFNWFDVEIYPSTTTAATVEADTPYDSDYDNSITSATSHSFTYAGTALDWDTDYKIRVRVSPNGGVDDSDWTGLVSFRTDSIEGPPTLDSVASDTDNPAWITDSTPTFAITRNTTAADTIDKMQYRIWNAAGSTLIYDSTMTDVTNSTSASLTYAGSLLVPGTTYKWDARYQNTVGPTSPWATQKSFRLNGPPTAPEGLFPPSGYVFLDTETKTFRADFDDPDEGTFGDNPVDWEIEIWNDDTDSQHGSTQSVTSGLTSGENETTWSGTAFVNGTNYSWRTRFQDSKSEWGAWSSSTAFRVSSAPNGTITSPTDGGTVTSVTPTINWTISASQTQERFKIQIDETDSAGNFQNTVTTLNVVNEATSTDSYVIPAGYLQDAKYYDITLTIWTTDNLADPSPSTINLDVNLDAPDPVESIDSLANQDRSFIEITWDLDGTWTLKTGHTFVGWRIRRQRKDFTAWETLDTLPSQASKRYLDHYAAHNVNYRYAVYAVTKKSGAGLELVGGDSATSGNIIEAQLASDDWHFIPDSRSASNNSILVVESESHSRPIQQEVFETLGSNRKVIMRGFVLGHEGELTTLWFNEETVAPEDTQLLLTDTYRGKRLVDYLTRNPGPHIIKSPFGDVWDAQFATPQYEWLPTGHLSVTLEWIETGTTSENEY